MAAAAPILASTIYAAHFDATGTEDGRPVKRRRLNTGCSAADDALGDGLVYGDGGVCCISSAEEDGGAEVRIFLPLLDGFRWLWGNAIAGLSR